MIKGGFPFDDEVDGVKKAFSIQQDNELGRRARKSKSWVTGWRKHGLSPRVKKRVLAALSEFGEPLNENTNQRPIIDVARLNISAELYLTLPPEERRALIRAFAIAARLSPPAEKSKYSSGHTGKRAVGDGE